MLPSFVFLEIDWGYFQKMRYDGSFLTKNLFILARWEFSFWETVSSGTLQLSTNAHKARDIQWWSSLYMLNVTVKQAIFVISTISINFFNSTPISTHFEEKNAACASRDCWITVQGCPT